MLRYVGIFCLFLLLEPDPVYYLEGPSWQGALCPHNQPDCPEKNTVAYLLDHNIKDEEGWQLILVMLFILLYDV